jgi:hypothetical protein
MAGRDSVGIASGRGHKKTTGAHGATPVVIDDAYRFSY